MDDFVSEFLKRLRKNDIPPSSALHILARMLQNCSEVAVFARAVLEYEDALDNSREMLEFLWMTLKELVNRDVCDRCLKKRECLELLSQVEEKARERHLFGAGRD
jgi:hypothetical protein